MKTLTREQATDDLCSREYDWLKREFETPHKGQLIPLINAGIGGFDKMDNTALESYYWTIYDETVKVIN